MNSSKVDYRRVTYHCLASVRQLHVYQVLIVFTNYHLLIIIFTIRYHLLVNRRLLINILIIINNYSCSLTNDIRPCLPHCKATKPFRFSQTFSAVALISSTCEIQQIPEIVSVTKSVACLVNTPSYDLLTHCLLCSLSFYLFGLRIGRAIEHVHYAVGINARRVPPNEGRTCERRTESKFPD